MTPSGLPARSPRPGLRPGLILFSLLLSILWIALSGRSAAADPPLWRDVVEAEIPLRGERRIVPDRYRTLALNADELHGILGGAPLEFSEAAKSIVAEISLPLPDGSMARFGFVESPVMEAGLAAKFPEITSFVGRGLDDPTLYARFGWTYKGFHAIIFNSGPTIYIDAFSTNDRTHYISYSRADFTTRAGEPFEQHEPEVDPAVAAQIAAFIAENPQVSIGGQLRTYRLALATTGEYSIFHSAPDPANVAAVMVELAVVVNRVNAVYERDTAVRMVLIANNDLVIYLNPATDPYTNNNGGTMLGQNQTTLDSIIGNGAYDIGHVLSTGGGGIAGLGVPCRAGLKARGVTGLTSPVGDPFYVDYVAHEMGHQFGANHTFNGNASSCGGSNRNAETAYEPGSGSTIMAYAGICGAQNLQSNSDDHFHAASIQEIVGYTTAGLGNACPTVTNTGNSPPTANPGTGGFTIPINTPFILTGSATDPNGDTLSYNWEQYDLGPAGAPNSPSGSAPIFRSFPSQTVPYRIFPKMSDIVNNTQTIGEILPSYTRSLSFRLTVRDNNVSPSAGGVHDGTISFSVTNTAGPFVVTNPNTAISWTGGASAPVTWNVANTNAAPVSCSAVNIALSTDGGYTYPIILATNTANDGSHTVVVPNNPTTQARVRVMCANNIFFDISNANFTILPGAPSAALSISKTVAPAGPVSSGAPLAYTIAVTNSGSVAATTSITDAFPATIVDASCDGVPGDLDVNVNINAGATKTVLCDAEVDSDIGIDLHKAVDRIEVSAGEAVTYTITVTNTSAVHTLSNVIVSDPGVSGCSPALGTPITLAPQASQNYVCDNVVINNTTTNTANVSAKLLIDNVAYASAPEDPAGSVSDNAEIEVVVSATDSVTVTVVIPSSAALHISKTVTPMNPVSPGSPLAYTIAVTNSGSIAATTTITDAFPLGVVNASCDGVPGDLDMTANINPGATRTVLCSAEVDSDIGVDIHKAVDRTEVSAGAVVTYTITVTNTSTVHTLSDVVVSDPDVGSCSPVLGVPITLGPQAFQSYVCANVIVNDTITNTANVSAKLLIDNVAYASAPEDPAGSGSDNAGMEVVVSASDSVTVTVTEPVVTYLLFMPIIKND